VSCLVSPSLITRWKQSSLQCVGWVSNDWQMANYWWVSLPNMLPCYWQSSERYKSKLNRINQTVNTPDGAFQPHRPTTLWNRFVLLGFVIIIDVVNSACTQINFFICIKLNVCCVTMVTMVTMTVSSWELFFKSTRCRLISNTSRTFPHTPHTQSWLNISSLHIIFL
jgi:hypothetical protein